MNSINENNLTEQSLIDWLKAEGYEHVYGPDINPGQPHAEREDFRGVVLKDRLLGAIRRINPSLPAEQAEIIVKEIVDYSHSDLILGNKEVYSWITNGKKTSWREDGNEKIELIKLIDFINPDANEFLVVNQFTVQGIDNVCRLDAVIFINGIPLSVFELKSLVRQSASIGEAYRDIEYYKKEIPKLFFYNQIIGLSDSVYARHGTISSSWERYGTWKGIETEKDMPKGANELETLAKGLFDKKRFIDVLQNFIVFEADSDGEAVSYNKKMCMYHQYYGVNKMIQSTIRSVNGEQERKIGVFWHTQGSGKSLSMVFYVNKTKRIPELKSPAYIFLTDREDLDDQLYRLFKRVGYDKITDRAKSILDLRDKVKELDMGVSRLIFSTIHKFQDYKEEFADFSSRENIIVLADEAHRTQYSGLAGNVRKALPQASFLAVTGTPIAQADGRNTQKVFGDIVSSYKISQSVDDGATVRIYYEGRLVPLHLKDAFIDSKFENILNEIALDERAKLQKELAVLEEIVGNKDRIEQIARDIVLHFNNRPIEGKAMIVTMSRRIAVAMYKEIQKISGAPECAVVISGSEDFTKDIQPEHDVKKLEKRFKKDNDPLKIAIVCDMWLTGFDVPCLHTMYLDKPLKNHGLMQAIARVNRVYKDKPAGLIVDYIGVAEHLKKALAMYGADIEKNEVVPLQEVIEKMNVLNKKVGNFFGDLDYSGWRKKKGVELTELVLGGIERVITKNSGTLSDERKMEYLGAVSTLLKLHAFVMPEKRAMDILSDVQFFQAVKGGISKLTMIPKTVFPEETESAIRAIVENAIEAENIIDLFKKEGGNNSISIFDPHFEEEIKKVRFKNLAVDAVRKLLDKEIVARIRTNKARYQTMLTLLTELIEKYENNVISSSEIIKQLLEIADGIKKLDTETIESGLSPDEIVFYDAFAKDPDLKKAGIDIKEFVKELIKRIRRDLTIDWTNNETIKARICQNVRLLLLQRGIVEEIQTKRLIESIYQEAVRVYRGYIPA